MPRLTCPCSRLTPLARWPEPQAHVRHVELGRVLLGAEREQLVQGDAEAGEVALDQRPREAVDAGRHRRVGGEHRAGAHRLQRLGERQPVRLGELADPLDAEEARVPLVGVVDLRRRRPGELAVGAQRPHAADAEQHLLAQPVVLVAAVEAVGDPALGRRVLLDVAVEQQQRHPADLGPPHVREQRAPLGQRDVDDDGGAVGLAQQLQREAVRVERGVVLELPAVAGQALGEVPGPVEQAHADQREAQVGGGLQVVAGQDAQAAGVLRQHLGDPELGGEVRDARGRLGTQALVPARRREVLVQVVDGVLQAPHELPVLGQRGQALGGHLAEHLDRVAAAALPQIGVEGLEEVPRLGVPRPAEIHHQLGERSEGLGEGARTVNRRSARTRRD
jgi:hypothetical protein